nr:hypothetical protein [Erwinia sorbitola]
MNTAIEMGHQPVALVRNKRKVKTRQKIKRSGWWLNEAQHSRILRHCLQTCGLMIRRK